MTYLGQQTQVLDFKASNFHIYWTLAPAQTIWSEHTIQNTMKKRVCIPRGKPSRYHSCLSIQFTTIEAVLHSPTRQVHQFFLYWFTFLKFIIPIKMKLVDFFLAEITRSKSRLVWMPLSKTLKMFTKYNQINS